MIYGDVFDENIFIGNAAIELLNNMLLNQEVYERVMNHEGFQHQMNQLFSTANGYLKEGLKDYTDKKVPADKPVKFDTHLYKFKIFMSILCILDDATDVMLKYIKMIKLTPVTTLFGRVKDQEFIADVVGKFKFIADRLIQKKTAVKIDTSSHEHVRELAAYFTTEEMRMMIAILGDDDITQDAPK